MSKEQCNCLEYREVIDQLNKKLEIAVGALNRAQELFPDDQYTKGVEAGIRKCVERLRTNRAYSELGRENQPSYIADWLEKELGR